MFVFKFDFEKVVINYSFHMNHDLSRFSTEINWNFWEEIVIFKFYLFFKIYFVISNTYYMSSMNSLNNSIWVSLRVISIWRSNFISVLKLLKTLMLFKARSSLLCLHHILKIVYFAIWQNGWGFFNTFKLYTLYKRI